MISKNSFKHIVMGSTPIVRSYRYICLSDRNRKEFIDNLTSAFNSVAFSSSYSSLKSPRSGFTSPKGEASPSNSFATSSMSFSAPPSSTHSSQIIKATMSAEELRKLVRMLCSDFPLELLDGILHILHLQQSNPSSGSSDAQVRQDVLSNRSLINFPQFVAAVNTCLLYKDFLSLVENLFSECGGQKGGVLDIDLFEEQLKHQIAIHKEEVDSTSISFPSDYHIGLVVDKLRNMQSAKTANEPNKSEVSRTGVSYDELVMVMFDIIR